MNAPCYVAFHESILRVKQEARFAGIYLCELGNLRCDFRPFSCKSFYLCPSCSRKRTILFAEHLTKEVLLKLPHRQFVFTMPKALRPFSGLQSIVEVFRRWVIKLPKAAHERDPVADDPGSEPLSYGDEEVDIDASKHA